MRKRDGGKFLVDATLVPTKNAPKLQKLAKELDMSIVPKQENISNSNPTRYKSVPPIESAHKQTYHPESAEQKAPTIHYQFEIIENPDSPSTSSLPLTDRKRSLDTVLPNEISISQGKSQVKVIPSDTTDSDAKFLSRSPSSEVWEKVGQIERRSRSNSSSDNTSFATPAESQRTSLEPKSFESPSKNVQDKISKFENRSALKFNEALQTVPEWKEEVLPNKDFESNQIPDDNETHWPLKTCENCCLTREATKAVSSNVEVKPKSVEDTGTAPLRSLENQQSSPSMGSLPQDPKNQSLDGANMNGLAGNQDNIIGDIADCEHVHTIIPPPTNSAISLDEVNLGNQNLEDSDHVHTKVQLTGHISKTQNILWGNLPASETKDQGKESEHEDKSLKFQNLDVEENQGQKDFGGNLDAFKTTEPVTKGTDDTPKKDFEPTCFELKTCENCCLTREATKAANSNVEVKPTSLEEDTGAAPLRSVPEWKQEVSPNKDFELNQIPDDTDTNHPPKTSEQCLTREATEAVSSNVEVKPTSLGENLGKSDEILTQPMVPAKLCNRPMCFCQALVKVGDLNHDDTRGTSWRIIERKTKKMVYRKK